MLKFIIPLCGAILFVTAISSQDTLDADTLSGFDNILKRLLNSSATDSDTKSTGNNSSSAVVHKNIWKENSKVSVDREETSDDYQPPESAYGTGRRPAYGGETNKREVDAYSIKNIPKNPIDKPSYGQISAGNSSKGNVGTLPAHLTPLSIQSPPAGPSTTEQPFKVVTNAYDAPVNRFRGFIPTTGLSETNTNNRASTTDTNKQEYGNTADGEMDDSGDSDEESKENVENGVTLEDADMLNDDEDDENFDSSDTDEEEDENPTWSRRKTPIRAHRSGRPRSRTTDYDDYENDGEDYERRMRSRVRPNRPFHSRRSQYQEPDYYDDSEEDIPPRSMKHMRRQRPFRGRPDTDFYDEEPIRRDVRGRRPIRPPLRTFDNSYEDDDYTDVLPKRRNIRYPARCRGRPCHNRRNFPSDEDDFDEDAPRLRRKTRRRH